MGKVSEKWASRHVVIYCLVESSIGDVVHHPGNEKYPHPGSGCV